MNDENFKLLQLFYAGALVDTANNYTQLGVIENVAERKKRDQNVAAPAQLLRLGVKTPAALFEKMKQVFGCIDWKVMETEKATRARSSSCLMCAIAKKSGAARPCDLFCINPMRAFGEAMAPGRTLTVEKTLWESDECVFEYK